MVGGIITPIPYAPIDGPPSNGPQVSYALLARRAFFSSKGIMPLNVNATDHAADEALGLRTLVPPALPKGWWLVGGLFGWPPSASLLLPTVRRYAQYFRATSLCN